MEVGNDFRTRQRGIQIDGTAHVASGSGLSGGSIGFHYVGWVDSRTPASDAWKKSPVPVSV